MSAKYPRRLRHRDDDPGRDEAVDRLVEMLNALVRQAEKKERKLCPLIGVGAPDVIEADGSIARGGQNLPGNWESARFNPASSMRAAIPTIGEHETLVVAHNDAVAPGLSQTPFMQDVAHCGVLTIGAGLGNARFTNRAPPRRTRADQGPQNRAHGAAMGPVS